MKWIPRIFSGLVAAFLLLFIATLLFGSHALPRCDSSAALDTVREVVIGNMNDTARQGLTEDALKASISFSDMTERRFDKEAELRECTAKIDVKVKDKVLFSAVPLVYTMTWKDKEEGVFQTVVERATAN